MSSQMILHVDPTRRTVGLDVVKALPTPEPTATHRPVPHWQMVEEVHAEIASRGLAVAKESYGITQEGLRMFGVIDTVDPAMPDGVGIAIGLRNSHDKAWAMGICAGTRVFVCDNLAFTGDVVRYRKHTSGIDPKVVVEGVLDMVLTHCHQEGQWLAKLKDVPVTETEGKALFMDLWRGEVLPTPMVKEAFNLWEAAAKEPHQPLHHILGVRDVDRGRPAGGDGFAMTVGELYGPRSLWSLYNVVTEVWKPLRNDNLVKRSARLNKVFGNVIPRASLPEIKELPADAVQPRAEGMVAE